MKHTVQGKHGHHYQLLRGVDLKPGEFFRMKKICISRSESANSDFLAGELALRSRLSLKWEVCMWCWRPDPGSGMYNLPGDKKPIALECTKCPGWKSGKKKNGA